MSQCTKSHPQLRTLLKQKANFTSSFQKIFIVRDIMFSAARFCIGKGKKLWEWDCLTLLGSKSLHCFIYTCLKRINCFKKYEILSLSEASQNLYSQTKQKINKIIFKKKKKFKVCTKIILISFTVIHCIEL